MWGRATGPPGGTLPPCGGGSGWGKTWWGGYNASAIELSDDLLGLTEKLAENAHDDRARRRLAEGWTWGPVRDDAARKHPDLVPYRELSEAEKHYDRDSAMATLRAIVALGYRIEPAASD